MNHWALLEGIYELISGVCIVFISAQNQLSFEVAPISIQASFEVICCVGIVS